ncbi:hypothetical protein COCOR_04938 [Corallococcus coralloides DSM 2259]|uniref:Uncharacterized protein n=1 Tax=Corallococcus coralloides (strain ATCC 25202 / DSM 2259 / NBRC 100086 / M2) TaxID=1144275 RepID=H8MNK9_CORCM|nr:hypothetical protein COCOR_04938 [Corallococcus coralloides DSM 2259]
MTRRAAGLPGIRVERAHATAPRRRPAPDRRRARPGPVARRPRPAPGGHRSRRRRGPAPAEGPVVGRGARAGGDPHARHRGPGAAGRPARPGPAGRVHLGPQPAHPAGRVARGGALPAPPRRGNPGQRRAPPAPAGHAEDSSAGRSSVSAHPYRPPRGAGRGRGQPRGLRGAERRALGGVAVGSRPGRSALKHACLPALQP